MNKINQKHLSTWIHRNARELEIAIWEYRFENGTKEAVVEALIQFQNEDGGFANTVDPDNWNTNSLPYATLFAIDILKEIEFFNMEHPIYTGIKKYLDKESNFIEAWAFTVPSNMEYPHASYYNYNADYNKTESIGIILGFCTFIIEHYKESNIYAEVLELINHMMDIFHNDNLGDMGPSGYITLIETMKKMNIEGYSYDELEVRLKELVNRSIQRDSEQWQYYGYRPSDYIKSPDSIFYDENKEIVEIELDYLYQTLPENDIWPISWSWFENNEKYPKESAIAGHWWKAIKAIGRTEFLSNFGRLE